MNWEQIFLSHLKVISLVELITFSLIQCKQEIWIILSTPFQEDMEEEGEAAHFEQRIQDGVGYAQVEYVFDQTLVVDQVPFQNMRDDNGHGNWV